MLTRWATLPGELQNPKKGGLGLCGAHGSFRGSLCKTVQHWQVGQVQGEKEPSLTGLLSCTSGLTAGWAGRRLGEGCTEGGEKAGANVVHLTSNQRLKEIKDQSEQFGNFNS